MLVVTRKDSESILISPDDGLDPDMTLKDLFEQGPIEITVFATGEKRVKMGVQAPTQLVIWRKDGEDQS